MAILYTTFNNEIGLQFFRYSLGLSPLGIHIIMPSFCIGDISHRFSVLNSTIFSFLMFDTPGILCVYV